jgi:hypothetical protein
MSTLMQFFRLAANAGPLEQAVKALLARSPRSLRQVLPNAGHRPNIEDLLAFNAALMRHYFYNSFRSHP